MGRGAWGWSGMGDVSWGGCSRGRVPARNRAGLGTVVGSGSPRRRSNMSRVGRKSPPKGWGQGRAQSLGEQRKRGGGTGRRGEGREVTTAS